MSVVLDTSAASRVMHRSPAALLWLARYKPGEVFLSAPVAAEIRFDLERLEAGSRKRRLLEAEYEALRRCVRFADWTEEAAHIFGREKARLERAGARIDDLDVVIGSIAIHLGARLATCNADHLGRLEGVVVESWAEEPPAA